MNSRKIHGGRFPGFITGKPVGLGGSLGRTEATGYGVVIALREALKELGMRPESTRASVQGFGNVAHYTIELYLRLGGRVVSVACWDQTDQCSYTYRRQDGIDLTNSLRSPTILEASTETKLSISDMKSYRRAPGWNKMWKS